MNRNSGMQLLLAAWLGAASLPALAQLCPPGTQPEQGTMSSSGVPGTTNCVPVDSTEGMGTTTDSSNGTTGGMGSTTDSSNGTTGGVGAPTGTMGTPGEIISAPPAPTGPGTTASPGTTTAPPISPGVPISPTSPPTGSTFPSGTIDGMPSTGAQ